MHVGASVRHHEKGQMYDTLDRSHEPKCHDTPGAQHARLCTGYHHLLKHINAKLMHQYQEWSYIHAKLCEVNFVPHGRPMYDTIDGLHGLVRWCGN